MKLALEGSLLGLPLALWIGLLLDLLLKGTLLFVAASLLVRLLGRGQAARRSLVWTLCFALLLCLPLAHAGSAWARGSGSELWRWSSRASSPPLMLVTQRAAAPPAGEPAELGGSREAGRAGGRAAPREQVPLWIAGVWLLGVAWLGARSLRALLHGRTLALCASACTDPLLLRSVQRVRGSLGISREVDLRLGEHVPVPFVWGMRRASLVLPTCVAGWDAAELRHLIRHELAHVRRHDLLRLLLVDLGRALVWFHPLAWSAARRVRLEIEMACDDLACRDEGDGVGYARQLLWFARRSSGLASVAAPAMVGVAELEERLVNVLEPEPAPSRRRRRVALGLPLLVLAFCLPLVSTRAPARVPSADAASLFAAAVSGDREAVEELLGSDARLLRARDARGMSALALAAWNGHGELVERLHALGADPDARNDNGLTPLFCALDRGRGSMARILMRCGADLDTRGYRGRTLLHNAARAGDRGVIRHLLERGADVNARDTSGDTPLDFAVRGGHQHVLGVLGAAGAEHSGNSLARSKPAAPVSYR